jgi:ketosteroid isomerase-like protein
LPEGHAYTKRQLENLEIVRTHIGAFSDHDIPKALSVLTEDVVDEDLGEPPKHRKKEIEEEIRGYITNFPDLTWKIANWFADGDYILYEIYGKGTRGISSKDGMAGTKVEFFVDSVVHVKDGKIDRMKAYIVPHELFESKSEAF